jgi:hypothetical protein
MQETEDGPREVVLPKVESRSEHLLAPRSFISNHPIHVTASANASTRNDPLPNHHRDRETAIHPSRPTAIYAANMVKSFAATNIAQLKNGVRALQAPVNTLESNWAFMVMTALAWNLKAWWALTLPDPPGRWQHRHRQQKQWALKLEFRTFLNAFVLLPCQIIKTGRKLIYRLLSWNPHLDIFFRLIKQLKC